jgi:hypothetical protein
MLKIEEEEEELTLELLFDRELIGTPEFEDCKILRFLKTKEGIEYNWRRMVDFALREDNVLPLRNDQAIG